MNRVYLPAEDLKLFGCAELTLDEVGNLDPQGGRLAELVRFEAARAWGWYDEGLQLLPMLDRRSAACCAAMAGIYRELLIRIARDPAMILDRRSSLPSSTKLRVAVTSLARSR
jgi:phytoene synthase